MKKLAIWLSAVVIMVVAADVLWGYCMKLYINKYHLRGDYTSIDHLIRESDEQLIVLGSSVALNSIDTHTLADSLHITAFNGGANGQSFSFYLTMLEIIAGRPHLNTIILCLAEYNFADTGLGGRFNVLVPYYHTGYPSIDTRLESMSESDRIMLKSNLYRYNTIWFRILLYHFIQPDIKGQNGFVAKGIPAYYPTRDIIDRQTDVSKQRRDEFDRFIRICHRRGLRLIVCIPPRFEERRLVTHTEQYLKTRSAAGDFELWFDPGSTPISADSTLFYDNTHLNYIGSRRYTDIVIRRLKRNK